MAGIEELINLVITFTVLLFPLWVLLSRRRRMQQEQQKRAGTAPGQPGRPQPGVGPRTARQVETAPPQEGDNYRDRVSDDDSYAAEQRRRSRPTAVSDASDADASPTREPGRLEKVLRDLLGVPDEEARQADKQARRQQRAHRDEPALRKKVRQQAGKPWPAGPTAPQQPVTVPYHPDVKIRAVMRETGSLSLSPGGMGSQQMRTAAGNLGASSSLEKTPPAVDSLGAGWRRIRRLPEFKRALILSELLGKPYSLKNREDA